MKFKVRDGFVVHLKRWIERNGVKEENQKSYFEGESIDMSPDDATDHLHKLEAVDRDAKDLVASAIVDIPPPKAAAIDQDALAAAIASTLLAMGVVKPATSAVTA